MPDKQTEKLPRKPPLWWTKLHDRAQSALSDEWQGLSELQHESGVSVTAFEDLVEHGGADRRAEQLSRNGINTGIRFYYRRAQA